MDNRISVKELNQILKHKQLIETATYSEVDIVFIAGLFLLYKINKQKLPSISFNLDTNGDRFEIHKSYFKQIEELYEVDFRDIIASFPDAESSKTSEPDSYSSSFAPPIYISKETINCFFGDDKENTNIIKLKNKYIDRTENRKTYKNSTEKEYFKQPNNIIKNLKESSPIHTFIFVVAYNKIDPFVNSKKKGFDSPTVVIKQIWQFTQEYVKGLYELAKNIVEHCGDGESDGEGMITIRAYDGKDNNKVLETYVFDYGEKGILQKLYEYTNKLKDHYSDELAKKDISESERNWLKTMYNCYQEDLEKLNSNYELSNFIIPPKIENEELQQQVLRDIAHFGLRKFYKLIKKYNGEMYIASNYKYFDITNNENNSDKNTIDFTGTSYFFQIPFDAKKFELTELTTSLHANLITALGSTTALQELHKTQHFVISTDDSRNIYQCINEEKKKFSSQEIWQDVILDFKLNFFVKDKKHVPSFYKCFEDLDEIDGINVKYLAIDLEFIINDVSILLRFLSHLTAKYDYSIIIYNLNNDLYYDMISDIENFYNERYIQNKQKATYWHENRAILFFTKTKERNFYFADILFGKEENDFLIANKIINSTFPNSKIILMGVDEEEKIPQISLSEFVENRNLSSFFHDKLLLPFDTILSTKTPLFISNLTTILTNELSQTEEKFKYSDLNTYIDKSGGYHISQTHFKIGGKIHSEDFYYAKGLFQNSFYTTRLAMYLTNKLTKVVIENKIKNLTLIGYEMYSELLLSLIEKFLEDSTKVSINHFIAQDEDGKLHFKPQKNYEDYIKGGYKNENSQAIIIVPIASTGSTAKKILETIKDAIVEFEEKSSNNKNYTNNIILDDAIKEAKQLKLLNTFYNILWAKPVESDDYNLVVKSIQISQEKEIVQEPIIELPATWFTLKNCKLCFGKDENDRPVKTLSLFETDKSSLTPAIVFGYPIGKKIDKNNDFTYINFDEVDFSDSLKYKTTYRNNEFLLYSTDTDKLIENKNNKIYIIDWLKSINQILLKKRDGGIASSDRIIIISPCHETNSGFINLVNQYVFNSAATIIHYQANVDFAENFKKMNFQLLSSSNSKIYFVDDSLISGKHFFNLFDLVKSSKEIFSYFDGTIVLSDKSPTFTHDRIVRWSKFMFSYVSYNQPPSISLSEQRPLEYERQRYKSLSNLALHDTLIKTFNQKVDKLNPKKLTNAIAKKRHLRLFEATHKIYDGFAKSQDLDIESDDFVDFKDKTDISENNNIKIKVLSQYPFILYKPLREKTFEWHKKLLKDILIQINNISVIDDQGNKIPISEEEYINIFTPFKLLIRRAVFLNNYQIIELDVIKAIQIFLEKINIYFDRLETNPRDLFILKFLKETETNLKDFPIFLISNFLEMIQKNGWVAIKLKENIKTLEDNFINSVSLSRQFYRMLQIETAVVVDDYLKMIEKEYHFKWRDMYKYTLESKYNRIKEPNDKFITDGSYITEFFKNNRNKVIENINKFEIVNSFIGRFFLNDEELIKPIENYLWIKQLIYNDAIAKKSHFPTKVNYQRKIDEILDKMKGLYETQSVQSFFIVTDKEQIPYVLYDKEYIIQDLEEEYKSNKPFINNINKILPNEVITLADGKKNNAEEILNALKYTEIYKFLYGIPDVQNLAVETIKEYEKKDDKWIDCYNIKYKPNIDFISNYKYLLLIRISNIDESYEFSTSGIIGFYCNEPLYNKPASILPKQLLMLLRRDINVFIEKHHKNDEFAKLREEEIRNRYAYLAGHGRKMLQDLIEDSGCKALFTDIVGTINKLQYLFSTENNNSKREKFLKEGFPYEENNNTPISQIIEEMAEEIFETSIIENNVELKDKIKISADSKDIIDKFHFNHKLLKFIVFELLVNAKKNRYHFINGEIEKNEVTILFVKKTNKIVIEINGTGAKFEKQMQDKINNINSHIKDKNKYEISSGIELMRDVLELINSDNSVYIPKPEEISETKYRNTVKVTLNEMNS